MQIIFVNKGLSQKMSIQTRTVSKKKLQRSLDLIIHFLKPKKIRNKLKLAATELTVVWLSAAEMKKINCQFRNKNKPTDVLSFLSNDLSSFGELLLCPEVSQKQAREFKHSFEVETVTMIVHGILHLLGYDHKRSTAEDRLMLRLQKQILDYLSTENLTENLTVQG